MRFFILLLAVAGFAFLVVVTSNDAATPNVVARHDIPRLEQGTQDAYSVQSKPVGGNVQGLKLSDRHYRSYD